LVRLGCSHYHGDGGEGRLAEMSGVSSYSLLFRLIFLLSLDDNIFWGYHPSMIKSFKSKEAEKLFNGHFSSKLPQSIQRTAVMKLKILNAASILDTLRIPPSNNLEVLHHDREGQHSIRINKQWRICFVWEGRDAFNVEIVDYH
jgi:toxin HigB-1